MDGVPFDKLDKMNNDMQTNTVPYEIYTEADENLSMDIKVIVNMRYLCTRMICLGLKQRNENQIIGFGWFRFPNI